MLLEADWVLPMSGPPLRGGAVAVSDGRVVEVGPAAELRARWGDEDRREFPGCALLPGLINTHSHLEYSAFRGFSRPCGFGEWMLRLLLARRKLVPGDYEVSARWGARECARAGMTCLADTSFEGWTSARAAVNAGLRARVHLEVIGPSDAGLPHMMQGMEERLGVLRAACAGPVEPGLSPHAPYTVSGRLYREVARFARREGLRVATHVAESRAEVEFLERGGGPIAQAYKAAHLWKGHRWKPPGVSPVGFLKRSGALGPEVLAVHCVELRGDDVAVLAESGTSVAHCPRSNQQLQCGTAPIAELRAAGASVGLGTDSLASNDSLDLFAEMRAALELSRARAAAAARALSPAGTQAADPLPPLDEVDVLRMATIEGAAALGLQDVVGSLEPGKDADIVVVRLATPAPGGAIANEDPVVAVVRTASAADVLITMVRGVTVFDSARAKATDRLDREIDEVRSKLGASPDHSE